MKMVKFIPALQFVSEKDPYIIIRSRDDKAVPFACMQNIYNALGSGKKHMLALDDMDHSLVRDPQCQLVFDSVVKYLKNLESQELQVSG
jgi:esterase/lipase